MQKISCDEKLIANGTLGMLRGMKTFTVLVCHLPYFIHKVTLICEQSKTKYCLPTIFFRGWTTSHSFLLIRSIENVWSVWIESQMSLRESSIWKHHYWGTQIYKNFGQLWIINFCLQQKEIVIEIDIERVVKSRNRCRKSSNKEIERQTIVKLQDAIKFSKNH